MPSAQKVAAAVQKLIPFPVHIAYAVDEPIKIIPHSTAPDKAEWWLGVLQHDRNYSPRLGFSYDDSRDAWRLRLSARDVTIRLTKDSGTLRVYGADRLHWFSEEILLIVLDPITAKLDQHLDLLKYKKLIQKLPTYGSVADSPGFIYPLWKSQLDRWFNLGMSTYIVTPSMDAERLADLIILMYKHILRRSVFNVKLIVKEWNNDTSNSATRPEKKKEEDTFNNDSLSVQNGGFEETKNNALNIIRETKCIDENTLQLQDVFRRMKVVPDVMFSARFICAYKDSDAEVLVTSAAFDKTHFDAPVRDTVAFHKITKHDLKKDYLITFLTQNEQ